MTPVLYFPEVTQLVGNDRFFSWAPEAVRYE